MTERFSSAAPRFVRIVGAGASPLDSMTLRVLYQLRNAAAMIRNRLDSTKVLDQILPQARRVYVGKAIGDRSVPQYGLHALLVAHTRIGSRVVRLKGGDSYVSGRDRDEIQALRVQSIAFEVVPGVTAPSGCGHSIDAPQPCRQLCVFAASFCARQCHVRLASSGAARADASFLHGCAASGANCRAAVQPWVGIGTPAAVVRDGRRPIQMVIACSLRRLVQMPPAYGPQHGLLIIGERVCISPKSYAD